MKVRSLTSAEIVAVGTEILLGSLVDTNTAWLSRRLAASGMAVHRHTAVGDDGARLVAVLSEAAARADLVLSTGGLGPTFDDLTNEALGLAVGREMVAYPEARRHVERTFRRFTGREPPPSAYKQALFPQGSELIVITLLLSYVLGDAETACGEGRHSPALRLLLAWFVPALRAH
jgi:nicotinamide-nucleotide amidase